MGNEKSTFHQEKEEKRTNDRLMAYVNAAKRLQEEKKAGK